jgi:hypothetical protein
MTQVLFNIYEEYQKSKISDLASLKFFVLELEN